MGEQSIAGAGGGQTDNQPEVDGLKSIESRAEARRVAGREVDPQQAVQAVQADLRDLARLQERWQQEHAGAVMAENIRTDAAYKTALTMEAPDVAVRVQELDAANDVKAWAKEARKAEDYAELKRDQAEKARRWAPEQAAALAVEHAKDLRQTQDVTERHYAGEDMAANARSSPAYRAALEAKAPDVAKELAEQHKGSLGGPAAANDAARGATLAIDAGTHVKGYTPSAQDKEAQAKRSQSEANRVENEVKPVRDREIEAPPERAREAAAQTLARAFASSQQADAVKAHPELAGAYVATAAVERKAAADGLTSEQRAVVASRVRQNVINAIEQGNVPEAQLNNRIEVRRDRDRHDEREVAR